LAGLTYFCPGGSGAADFGNQTIVAILALLRAEIRDVPCNDQDAVFTLRGDFALLLPAAEVFDLCIDVELKLELRFRKYPHDASKVDMALPFGSTPDLLMDGPGSIFSPYRVRNP
jgi:hypothetical protein